MRIDIYPARGQNPFTPAEEGSTDMEYTCDYCGTNINEGLEARFYPEDDSLLCERCFPLEQREQAQKTALTEEFQRSGQRRLISAEEV